MDEIDINDMPEEWNWEDILGYDFSGSQADQGHCGSCYLIATNSILEARLKIWYGVEKKLSA